MSNSETPKLASSKAKHKCSICKDKQFVLTEVKSVIFTCSCLTGTPRMVTISKIYEV